MVIILFKGNSKNSLFIFDIVCLYTLDLYSNNLLSQNSFTGVFEAAGKSETNERTLKRPPFKRTLSPRATLYKYIKK